ncbi:MAG: hypothetical protein AAF985_21800 [Bacteroidota bacterium]
MLQKDSLSIGALLGLLIPFIGFAVLLEVYDQLEAAQVISDIGLSETFRKRTIALLAICFNLIPFRLFNRRRLHNSMRGVIFPTVLYVATWFFYFSSSLFS